VSHNPNRQGQTRERMRRRFEVFAILLCSCAIHAYSQSSSPKPNVAEADRIAQLEDGLVSGDVYHNVELGFRYQFPHGWIVNDKGTQEKALSAGHQFVWADDISAKREKKATRQCAKGLLFVTQYPEEMRLNSFGPLAFLIAADPKCIPGVSFPSTAKDHEAIQRIVSQLGVYFKTLPINSNGSPHIRAFDNGGRVMLEVSNSFSMSTHEPGSDTFRTVRSSILVMQARDYWVMWMFASDNDTQLNQLRATKIFFDAAPAGSAEPR
jgi:hypothetical protein